MNGVFSLDVLRALQQKMDQQIAPSPSILNPAPMAFMGMQVSKSPAFPHEFDCSTCHGTGHGSDSTYCQRCTGAGRVRIDGMMQNGPQTIMLTAKLPRLFEPAFPVGLVAPKPLAAGLV